MGMYWLVSLVFSVLFVGILYNAHAETLAWKSDYSVGFFKPEQSEFNLKIVTLDKNSLKLEWSKPLTMKNLEGYQILRKVEGFNYQIIAEQNSRTTTYSDHDLSKGYYTYVILPMFDERLDKPTKHGITRTNDLFRAYVKGQEVIAKEKLRNMCSKCFNVSFEEIDQIFAHDFPNGERFTPKLKATIEKEALKASIRFNELYDMKTER